MNAPKMPYIPPSHTSAKSAPRSTSLRREPLNLTTYLSRNRPTSLVKSASRTENSQPESEVGLQPVATKKEPGHFRATENVFVYNQALTLARQSNLADMRTVNHFNKAVQHDLEKLAREMPKTNSSVQINTHLTNCSDVRLIRYKEEAAKKEKPETLYQEQPLTRNRSGELVRSALRSSNTTKSSFSKAVHFHSHLEHIRPFLKFDKPSAVNTDLPPADKCECTTETRLGADIFGNGHDTLSDWELISLNLPIATPQRLLLPVRVESVFMSPDNTEVIGSVEVTNIAYNKVVIARYTLDNWKTTSEVVAKFDRDTQQGKHSEGYNYFIFKIKVIDQTNLELKTLLFAVKYRVNGQEFWDNNNSANFQFTFRKKPKLHKVNTDMQHILSLGSNWLPKSHQSIPAAFENFADVTGVHKSEELKQLINNRLSRPSTSPAVKGLESTVYFENSTLIVLKPKGQPFRSRYNFNNSLSVAIRGTEDTRNGNRSLSTMEESDKLLADKSSARNKCI
jgi:hypothetical protein